MTSTIKFSYFKSLFERTDQIDKLDPNTLLLSIALPSVTNDQKVVCVNDLTNKELFDALKGIPNNKSPDNDGLTKEFYETFWDELKGSFINLIPNNKSPGNDGLTKEFYEIFWYELKDSFINLIKLAYQKKGIKYFSTSSSYQINRKKRK